MPSPEPLKKSELVPGKCYPLNRMLIPGVMFTRKSPFTPAGDPPWRYYIDKDGKGRVAEGSDTVRWGPVGKVVAENAASWWWSLSSDYLFLGWVDPVTGKLEGAPRKTPDRETLARAATAWADFLNGGQGGK